ncbi:tail fiber domain-containing protein [Salmonella enterica subsp. salamae]|nr:tail fiber domain-containing protein [Salmonella enterica subsp. salamae]
MSSGTLSLTNNSVAVTGTGTTFTTDLTAGDFIVVTVGGVPYTLPVKTVDSVTQLTLVSNYTGPTQSGVAWSAVPRVALNMVTAALVAQSAEALRGLNYDKQNWQQFFTADGDVTITLPDTSQTTGPSAKKLISSVANKADKVNGVVPKEQGGTGLSQPFGDKAGQFCQGNDQRLNTINGKSGGMITTGISFPLSSDGIFSEPIILSAIDNAEGSKTQASLATFTDGTQRVVINNRSVGSRPVTLYNTGGVICQAGIYAAGPSLTSYFLNYESGPVGLWIDGTRLGALQLTSTSDRYLKKEIKYLSDKNVMGELSAAAAALSEVLEWKPATFRFKKRGIIPEGETKLGFIANDLVVTSPECVKGKGLEDGYDENDTADAYSLDEIAMIAKLTLSIQELQKQISELQTNGAGS